jgi:hypothetical protein
MVYNNQNYRVSGLCASSGILNSRKHDVSETRSVSALSKAKETLILLGPLETANPESQDLVIEVCSF